MKVSFRDFFKGHWLLFVILFVVLCFSILLFLFVFRMAMIDISAWASLIAGVFTYIGSSILGVLVYYNSWTSIKNQEIVNRPKLKVSINGLDYDGNHFIPYTYEKLLTLAEIGSNRYLNKGCLKDEQFYYIGIDMTNLSENLIESITIESVYHLRLDKAIKQENLYAIYGKKNNNDLIAFRESYSLFLGIDKNLFDINYPIMGYELIAFVLRIKDVFLNEYYHIYHIVFGGSFSVLKTIILDKASYERRVKNHGSPIIITKSDLQFLRA